MPLDLTKESRGEVVEQVGEGGVMWEMAAASSHNCVFLIPKSVTSERPIAHMSTMIRWLEALPAPEVAKWQQKESVEWDATDGRAGGAERTAWETLLEMDRFRLPYRIK